MSELRSSAVMTTAPETFETLLGAAPTPTMVLDPRGHVLVWNKAAEETYGWTAPEVMGSFFPLIPDDGLDEFHEFRRRVLRGETIRGVEVRRRCKDGTLRLINLSIAPVRDSAGRVGSIIIMHQDITDHRAAEERLRDEAEFKLTVINTVGALVVALDPYGRIMMFNAACEASTGYLAEEVIGKPFYELLRGRDEWDQAIQSLERMRRGLPHESREPYERDWIAKNGKKRRILWTNEAVRNPDGTLRYFIGTGIDITDKRRAESALQAIEAGTSRTTGAAFFANLVEQLAKALGVRCAMVAEIDAGGTRARSLATWDRAPASDLDYDLSGTPCAITVREGVCFYPSDVAGQFPGDPLLAAMGLQSYMGTRLRDSAGRAIGLIALMHDGPFPDEEMARSLLLLFSGRAEAELERTRAEERARNLQRLLQDTIDSMPSVLAGVDQSLAVTHWNRGAEEITGATAATVIGRSLFDALPALRAWKGAVEAALSQSRLFRQSRIPWDRDGQARLVELTMYPLQSESGVSAVVRLDDVTDRTRMEAAVVQSDKMMSLGGLAAGMAHEINNPLAGMMQNAQVVEHRLSPDLDVNRRAAEACGTDIERVRRYAEERGIPGMLGAIRESGGRAARIVDNMLRFARKSDARLVPCDLNDLIERTLEMARSDYDFRKRFDFQAVQVDLDLDPSLPPVKCRELEIQQVFLNIIRNAAAAMMSGGGRGQPPRLEIATREETGFARIELRDNGPGMSEEVRERIFEPFFSTKPEGEGTGLGLSVSHFIVTQNHEGQLTVESSSDRGACFIVRLPLLRSGETP